MCIYCLGDCRFRPEEERLQYQEARRLTQRNGETMMKTYDFSKGKRGAVVPTTGKTRITIYMDDAVLNGFKAQSEKSGKGYQTLINEALKAHLGLGDQPVTQELVRKIVREELAAHG